MPYAPKRPCNYPSCPELVDKGYCDEHTVKIKASKVPSNYQLRRGSSASRGYGKDWQIKRQQAMMRDMFLCKECERKGVVEMAEEVHHIIPIRKRSDLRLVLSNLMSVCKPCYRKLEEIARSSENTKSQHKQVH